MEERTIVSFDYAIKYLLRDKANFDILEGFLSELLARKVTVLDVLESESNKSGPEMKINRIDLKARIDDRELAIFEVQFSDKADYIGKALYDACKAVVEQVAVGGSYNVKKVYMINIVYFDVGADREYLLAAKLDGFKGLRFGETIPFAQRDELAPPDSLKTDIHPEYYLILPNKFDDNVRDRFDEWIYTLKKSAVPENFTAAGLKEASVKLNILKMPPAERKAYERYMEDMASLNSMINTAEWKGHWKGHAAGRAEGQVAGRAEGEKQKAAEIAKNLKNIGIPTAQITEATGMTAEEVEKL